MISTKSFIAIIAISCIALVASGRKLKCADDLKLKACYLESFDSTGAKTTYVKSCPKGKFCRQTYFEDSDDGIDDEGTQLQEIGICVKPLKLRDEGDKCEADGECRWGLCKENKCTATADGGNCRDHKECSGISYCKGIDSKTGLGVCAALVPAGGECVTSLKSEDCAWGSVCNKNKCVELYSLDDGTPADNGMACKGGEIADSTTRGTDVCASHSYDTDKSCDANTHKCKYILSTGITTDTPETDTYFCDQDKDGNYVCPLIESSEEFKKYLKVYRETLADMDDDDKQKITNEITLNDKKVAEAYAEYWYAVQMKDAGDCIQDFYYQIELSSSSLKYTLLSLVSLFLILA